MTDDPSGALGRLRADFDRAFAAAPPDQRRDLVALLAIRAGGDGLAVRVLETAGLLATPPVVAVPGARPELLGVAGLRGAILPVFALARLLGREPSAEARWLLLAGAGEGRVGIAFEAFEGHVVVPAPSLRPAPGGPLADELAEVGGGERPVLRVPALLRAVTGAE